LTQPARTNARTAKEITVKLCTVVLRRFWRDDRGQDLIEYALLVSLVTLVAVGAVTQVSETIRDVFWDVIAASIP
jgi:Flp pilus assembly pilin Flp